MGLRYLIQGVAMLGDLLLLAAIVITITNPLGWIVIPFAISTWRKQGGFIAWRRSSRKKFMANAKTYGL